MSQTLLQFGRLLQYVVTYMDNFMTSKNFLELEASRQIAITFSWVTMSIEDIILLRQ